MRESGALRGRGPRRRTGGLTFLPHPLPDAQAPLGETPVTAELVGEELRVRFTEPVRGVAPGQAVVLYDGTRVVGSATIAATERATAGATA